MRGSNWPGRPGTTSTWPWKTIVGPSAGPTVAARTGRPPVVPSFTSISCDSSQPLTKPAAALIPSTVEVS